MRWAGGLGLLLLACSGSLPDIGGIDDKACEILPETECVDHVERYCGWRLIDDVAAYDESWVSEDGAALRAPEGHCMVVEKPDSGSLLPRGGHPCDAEAAPRCVVLMPGEEIQSYQRVDTEAGGGDAWAYPLVDGLCPRVCD